MHHQEEHREIELRQIDAARGRARRYHLSECRSLFGELGLLVTWGRIGKPTRLRLETFASEDQLDERRAELLARRFTHGYSIQRASDSRVASGD